MWILQRKSDGKIISLLNKEYTIGRRNCTIELSDDLSVSRQHLKINVDYSNLQNSGTSVLKVMDLGSTYGVFINPAAIKTGKIEPKTWVLLDRDSSLHFGVKNEWIVKWRDIYVVCSGVGSQERRRLIGELLMLGAKLLSDWQDDITHLVTESIVLTQKVLDSLLSAKPIVLVNFFESWVKVLEESPWSLTPDVSKFTPSIGQALGQFGKQCFLPKLERKSLFVGKTFMFATSNELKSSMAIAVSKAGGKVTNDFETFHTNDTILVDCTSPSPSKDYVQLLKSIAARGERSIPQKEIGLAILSCSSARFCNPRLLGMEHKVADSQVPSSKPEAASVEISQYDQETQVVNVSRPVRRIENGEEPPSKRNRIENPATQLTQVPQTTPKRSRTESSAPEITQVLQPPSKKIHLDERASKAAKINSDEDTAENLLKGKGETLRHSESSAESTKIQRDEKVLDTLIHPTPHSGVAKEQSSTSQMKSTFPSNVRTAQLHPPDDTKDVLKRKQVESRLQNTSESLISEHRKKQRNEEIFDKSIQNSPRSKLANGTSSSNRLKPFSSTELKRETSFNNTFGNDHSRLHWHGSPKKLDTNSKLMVKSSLIRPEFKERGNSQKSQTLLKENHIVTRIRAMKIACLKEGKWTKINK